MWERMQVFSSIPPHLTQFSSFVSYILVTFYILHSTKNLRQREFTMHETKLSWITSSSRLPVAPPRKKKKQNNRKTLYFFPLHSFTPKYHMQLIKHPRLQNKSEFTSCNFEQSDTEVAKLRSWMSHNEKKFYATLIMLLYFLCITVDCTYILHNIRPSPYHSPYTWTVHLTEAELHSS